MSAKDIEVGLTLLSLAVNLGDRLLTGRGGFFQFPRSGALGYVFGFCILLLPALALLCIFQAIPDIYFFATGTAWFVCVQCYDIYYRHREAGRTS